MLLAPHTFLVSVIEELQLKYEQNATIFMIGIQNKNFNYFC